MRRNNYKSFTLAACLIFFGMHVHATGKQTAEDYISRWKDEAIYQMAMHHIPASITLAQGMLESGNGNSRLALEGNNHFGIKCHNDWQGKTIHEDDETNDECFRRYKHPEDSFEDHSQFLQRKRYESLFKLDPDDFKGWARGLKDCGYATNPKYPDLLIDLIRKHDLERFDKEGMEYIRKGKVPHEPGHRREDKPGSAAENGKKKEPEGSEFDSLTVHVGRAVALSGNRIRYIIARDGDDESKIAADMDMMPWQIRRYNDLEEGGTIQAGDVIYLQPKRGRAAEASCVASPGDTWSGISQKFGVKMNRLKKMNPEMASDELVSGSVVRLR